MPKDDKNWYRGETHKKRGEQIFDLAQGNNGITPEQQELKSASGGGDAKKEAQIKRRGRRPMRPLPDEVTTVGKKHIDMQKRAQIYFKRQYLLAMLASSKSRIQLRDLVRDLERELAGVSHDPELAQILDEIKTIGAQIELDSSLTNGQAPQTEAEQHKFELQKIKDLAKFELKWLEDIFASMHKSAEACGKSEAFQNFAKFLQDNPEASDEEVKKQQEEFARQDPAAYRKFSDYKKEEDLLNAREKYVQSEVDTHQAILKYLEGEKSIGAKRQSEKSRLILEKSRAQMLKIRQQKQRMLEDQKKNKHLAQVAEVSKRVKSDNTKGLAEFKSTVKNTDRANKLKDLKSECANIVKASNITAKPISNTKLKQPKRGR